MHTVSFAWARAVAACAVVGAALGLVPAAAHAQGVTSGAVSGVVTDENGRGLEGAVVVVVNRATGFQTGAQTRANGRYFIQNLEVGRNYLVRARLIGYRPEEQAPVIVTLGQTTRVDFKLQQSAQALQAVVTIAETDPTFSPTKTGVATTVGDTAIRRLPNLNRDISDLVKITPQVAQPTSGGPSAGGAWNRLNNFTIDGANANDRFNLNSTGGTPGGNSNGRTISIEAVKELQVLLSPTDVRQGNFAGALINAVTKNGTNTWTGGATYTFRNASLARDTNFIRAADQEIQQYSFSLGGPIIKDRLHFFVAPEFQRSFIGAAGPFAVPGQRFIVDPSNRQGVSVDTIARIQSIAQRNGINAGDANLFRIPNPLTNLFARLDFQVNESNRLVVRQLVNRAELTTFSRNLAVPNTQLQNQSAGIRLTSQAFLRQNTNNSTVVQLFTNAKSGASNEFSFGFNRIRDLRVPNELTPEVTVPVTRCDSVVADGNSCGRWGSSQTAVTFGGERFSAANDLQQDILEVTNNFTVPLGENHTFTVGGRFEHSRIFNLFGPALNGAYRFANTAAFDAGTPQVYSVAFDNGAGIPARFRVNSYSAYAQDVWTPNRNLTVTYGLRVDVFQFRDSPAFNGFISPRIPGLDNSAVPRARPLFSPRFGLNWNIGGTGTNQLRLNTGVFTGPPPFILLSNAFGNTGLNLAQLDCGLAGSGTVAPGLVSSIDALPRSCVGQAVPTAGAAGTNVINANDPNYRFPQFAVASFGYDRKLPWDVTLTLEGTYREAINGTIVEQANLIGPRAGANGNFLTDPNGRVLYTATYGTATAGATGIQSLTINNNEQRFLLNTFGPNGGTVPAGFGNGALVVTNQGRDRNWTLSGSLRKSFGRTLDLGGSYTYMRALDVQSLTSDQAISLWQNGRQLATAHTDYGVTTSYFQRPHRALLYGTLTAPWRRIGQTDVTFYYEGMSGTPFTYTTNGDLNGDGFNGNDPIYIPRDATNPAEMRIGRQAPDPANPVRVLPFALDAQSAQLFENFIRSQPCLAEQRGQLMARNSCRSPWQNRMDVSLRQSLPRIAGQNFTVQLDIFNFLNFLNNDWGRIELPVLSSAFPSQQILLVRGVTPGTNPSTQQANYEIDSALRNNGGENRMNPFAVPANSIGNLYRMQLTFRWAF